MQGFHQRYQNGFDCQGLWIEVGVERELGLNSKREIEEYGLAEFARSCREKVVWSATRADERLKRLGQWMDWGDDYFTFSDTNIEYIWRFLKLMHERGCLYKGHRSTEWCPRCGTSISQHELSQSGRVPGQDRSRRSSCACLFSTGRASPLVVWTTTPWTLPANVAAAVKPGCRVRASRERRVGRRRALSRRDASRERSSARSSSALGYRGPFDDLAPAAEVEHRVIPWDEVSLEEGTGIVHIAPGAGQEDFELGRVHGLPVLSPVDESGRFYDSYGWLHGLSTTEAADQIVGWLAETGFLLEAGVIEHRYPHCWRCDTPLIWRVTDDWMIARRRASPAAARRERDGRVDARRTWASAWTTGFATWATGTSRAAATTGFPCRSTSATADTSPSWARRRSSTERAVSGLDQLEELRRPWVDEVPIRCEACGETVSRITDVGDVWLDAGIVPFSTLGWESTEYIPQGYATGAAKGLTSADLPDHAYWEEWFPADWVSEMREQIRLWFYSQLFMSVALVGRAPFTRVLGYEKMLDEHGREMHGSWGNMIAAGDAFARMGADVMRWQYCSQPPDRNLLFGFGPAHEIQRKLLTLWNSTKFLVDYANIDSWKPEWDDLAFGPSGELEPLDRWLVERTHALVTEATAGYESWLTVDVVRAYEAFVDDVSNWYIRRSRRRFWDGDAVALRTLWYALVQGVRVVAPLMPFLSDHLWRVLTAPCDDAPDSVHLAGWPKAAEPDAALLSEISELRRVVELGRQARATSGLKLRQPLRALVVEGALLAGAHVDEIADELRVREVSFGPVEASELRVKPNLPLLGPKLGKELGAVRTALQAGDFEQLQDGGVRVAGHDLTREEVLVERHGKDGWAVAASDGLTVALDLHLDEELVRAGRVYDLIHGVNTMRKEAGLELTDRIGLTIPEADADLLEHEDWIAQETLSVSVAVGAELGLSKV